MKDDFTELLNILGEERIKKIVDLIGNQKISFFTLNAIVKKHAIIKALHSGSSIKTIAREFDVSRMTVYRMFRQEFKGAVRSADRFSAAVPLRPS